MRLAVNQLGTIQLGIILSNTSQHAAIEVMKSQTGATRIYLTSSSSDNAANRPIAIKVMAVTPIEIQLGMIQLGAIVLSVSKLDTVEVAANQIPKIHTNRLARSSEVSSNTVVVIKLMAIRLIAIQLGMIQLDIIVFNVTQPDIIGVMMNQTTGIRMKRSPRLVEIQPDTIQLVAIGPVAIKLVKTQVGLIHLGVTLLSVSQPNAIEVVTSPIVAVRKG